MDKTNIFKKAEKKAKAKKRALTNFILWFAFIFFFIFLDINEGGGIEWAFFPIFGWGIGVLIQGIRAFDFFGLGNKWEKEEIQKEVEKRKKVLEAFEEQYGDLDELELDDLREIRKQTRNSDFV